MKKIFKLLPVILIAPSMVSCCEDPEPEEPVVEKTELKYTYTDYCNNSYRTCSAIPNKGEPKLLVIPVYFSDSSDFIPEDKKESVRQDIQTAFFGTKEDIGYESVSSYYSALSQGKCNIKGLVSNWIDVEYSYIDFSVDESATMAFCLGLVEKYFSTSNDVRTTYDLDKDGFLDGVAFIYAAPDHDNIPRGSSFSNLWAYTNWYPSSRSTSEPQLCNFMWASYDFMYSRKTASDRAGSYYGSGDNTACSLDTHIYIHETGHMFGLVDYYDYSYQFNPAGSFSMQDCNIGCHDPYSVMALGWASPYIPTESCTITLNTFQSSRDCIILCNTWNEFDSPFDEYLIVEFYSPDGLNEYDHLHQYQGMRPTGPNESGIRLWHVDARLVYDSLKDVNKVTSNPSIENTSVMHMMSNTYGGSDVRGYTSPLGSAYTRFNLLQLIRNEATETYQSSNAFDKFSLFKNGDKFSMNSFAKQFPINGKLNSNKVLGWTFTVEIADNQAKIALTRTL